MQKSCLHCTANFEITESDLEFYKKVSPKFKVPLEGDTGGVKTYEIPPPKLCPDCRQQRRLAFRNERKLYKRTCDLCQKEIIAIYPQDAEFPVYCSECWWSDKWDGTDFGKDFDPANGSFFEQFQELKKKIPVLNLINHNSENSEYTHLETDSKNCYMNFGGHYNQNCFYNLHAIKCSDCLDNYFSEQCELCYECFKCHNCYNTIYSDWCFNCHDCSFCSDLKNCKNCFGCVGLRHKQYYFFNQKLTKEEYETKLKELNLNHKNLQSVLDEFKKFKIQAPHLALRIENSENCLGDFVKNSKNCSEIYEVENAEDCKFCDVCSGIKDCYEGTRTGFNTELCYENMAGTFLFNTLFSNFSFNHLNNCFYIDNCFSSNNLFGCIGLKKKQYCILNKQYTKEEYETLVPKIIEHMQKNGDPSSLKFRGAEWGEFFPVELSPFAYNETVAQEYFPMTKEEVLAKGWKWKDEEDKIPDVKKIIPAERLPDSIEEIPDDVLNWAIKCEKTGRPFKIQKSELEFYRKMNLPIPHFHPDVRHEMRMAKRNPRKLWKRNCAECKIEIETTYAPDRTEKVLCEACYLKEVN